MYNSMVVAFFVKIWDTLVDGYKTSFLKKAVDGFAKFIKFLFKGSLLLSFFVDNKYFLDNSFIYRIYKAFMDWFFSLIKKANSYLKKIRANSLVSRSIDGTFETEFTIFKGFNVFILFFGIGLFILNFVNNSIFSRAHKLSLIIIIIASLGIAIGDNLVSYTFNSNIYKWLVSIWTVDEGGDQWW